MYIMIFFYEVGVLGPVHTYPDIFESATFFFGFAVEFAVYVLTVAVSGKKKLRIGKYPNKCGRDLWRIRKKRSPLSRLEKNKSATNPITCARVNPDIFESDDVKSVSSLSPKNKPIWRLKVESTCRANGAHFPPLSHSTAHALKTFLCRGALGTRVTPDTISYLWTGEFDLNTPVDGEIFKSGKKKLRIQKYPDTCGRGLSNPNLFAFNY